MPSRWSFLTVPRSICYYRSSNIDNGFNMYLTKWLLPGCFCFSWVIHCLDKCLAFGLWCTIVIRWQFSVRFQRHSYIFQCPLVPHLCKCLSVYISIDNLFLCIDSLWSKCTPRRHIDMYTYIMSRLYASKQAWAAPKHSTVQEYYLRGESISKWNVLMDRAMMLL